jgi:hypothetical protein
MLVMWPATSPAGDDDGCEATGGVAIHGSDSPQRKTGRFNHGKLGTTRKNARMTTGNGIAFGEFTAERTGKTHSPQRHRGHREIPKHS